jgi:hypothetical protein
LYVDILVKFTYYFALLKRVQIVISSAAKRSREIFFEQISPLRPLRASVLRSSAAAKDESVKMTTGPFNKAVLFLIMPDYRRIFRPGGTFFFTVATDQRPKPPSFDDINDTVGE